MCFSAKGLATGERFLLSSLRLLLAYTDTLVGTAKTREPPTSRLERALHIVQCNSKVVYDRFGPLKAFVACETLAGLIVGQIAR